MLNSAIHNFSPSSKNERTRWEKYSVVGTRYPIFTTFGLLTLHGSKFALQETWLRRYHPVSATPSAFTCTTVEESQYSYDEHAHTYTMGQHIKLHKAYVVTTKFQCLPFPLLKGWTFDYALTKLNFYNKKSEGKSAHCYRYGKNAA